MAIIVNDGALEAPTRENLRIGLMHTCDIYAVVSLSKFAFAPYTREKTYILFMQRKQEDGIGEIQDFPIWHFILDYDGYANSDKRYRTKYHDDIPELEDKFSDVVNLARLYATDRGMFDRERQAFEREVNRREREEGLWGMKYAYVETQKVRRENCHNLLSEFYLRPVSVERIGEDVFSDTMVEVAAELSVLTEKVREIKSIRFDFTEGEPGVLGDVLDFKGGNSGLTEEFVYSNQPTNEAEKIPILSSATLTINLMGYVSRNARPEGKCLKVFKGPCILVARNGFAGTMRYVSGGEFTTNDHAYVLVPKKAWSDRINLRWFTYEYQEMFYNLVTSKSDNATFNKDYAEKQGIIVPAISVQNLIAQNLLLMDRLMENVGGLKEDIEKFVGCRIA